MGMKMRDGICIYRKEVLLYYLSRETRYDDKKIRDYISLHTNKVTSRPPGFIFFITPGFRSNMDRPRRSSENHFSVVSGGYGQTYLKEISHLPMCLVLAERIPFLLLSRHAELESERVEVIRKFGSSDITYDE